MLTGPARATGCTQRPPAKHFALARGPPPRNPQEVRLVWQSASARSPYALVPRCSRACCGGARVACWPRARGARRGGGVPRRPTRPPRRRRPRPRGPPRGAPRTWPRVSWSARSSRHAAALASVEFTVFSYAPLAANVPVLRNALAVSSVKLYPIHLMAARSRPEACAGGRGGRAGSRGRRRQAGGVGAGRGRGAAGHRARPGGAAARCGAGRRSGARTRHGWQPAGVEDRKDGMGTNRPACM